MSKFITKKDKNNDSFVNSSEVKQSPITNQKNPDNFNKIELSNSGSKNSKKHTRDNSSNKEELLLESVDDDEYHRKRLAKMDDSDDERLPSQKFPNNSQPEPVINNNNYVPLNNNDIMIHPNLFKDTAEFIPEPDKLKVFLLNNNHPDNYIPLEIEHPMPDNEVELMLLLNYLANEDNLVTLRVSIRTNDEHKPE